MRRCLQIKKEAVLHLLAVIADVDPGSGLPGDDLAHRFPPEAGNRGGVDGFAFLPVGIERRELAPARQAAGVGRQDAINALLHAPRLFPRAARSSASDFGIGSLTPQACIAAR